MLTILQAIVPVFALVIIGAFFRKKQFPGKGFWPLADRLTYFVLLPSLLIEKLALAAISGKVFLQISIILPLCIIAIFLLALGLCWLLKIPARGVPSVVQGSIRPNTYVALATAGALYGQEGLTITALCLLVAVPLVNVISVFSFALYIPENSKHPKAILKNIFTNPLVIACLIGIFLNVINIGLPFGSADLLGIMSKAALPMGLLSVGNGLKIEGLLSQLKPALLAFLLKLIALPTFIFLIGFYFNLAQMVLWPIVLMCSVPCAISSYILAGQLKGDQVLMASIITLETLLAIITMPLMLFLVSK